MDDGKKTWTVLAVDDEPQILNAVEDLLEDEFTVLTAHSAEEALEVLRTHRVAVVISDQRMPGMEGDEFLARAREHSAAARILLTGYADFSAVVRAVNNGQIYAYMAKPWEPAQLRLMVHRAAEHCNLLQELNAERRLLHLLMDSVPDAIFFKDRSLRFLRANRVVAQRLKVADPQTLLGHHIGEFLDADSAEWIDSEERSVVERGQRVLDAERLVGHVDGGSRWYAVTKVPMVEVDGTVVGLIGIGRDVHDRHVAETRLRDSEERFRDFADTASDWFWEMDADLRFSHLSEKFHHALGQPASTFLGAHRGEGGYVEAEGHSMAAHLADLEAHRPFRDFVYGRPLPDGAVLWAAISGKPCFDPGGRFLGYRGTGRDVTAEREALAGLADSERQVRMLLESTAEGIYGVDRDGRCSFVNPAALRLLGYRQPADLLGRTLHSLTHHTREDGTPYPRSECPFSLAMGNDDVVRSREELLWRADGSSFYAEMSMHPVVRDGRVDGAVVSFFDVTDRRRARSAVMLVNRIAVSLADAAGIESALETTLRLVCASFTWKLGEAWVPAAGGSELELAAVVHDLDPRLERFALATQGLRFRRGDGLPGRVWESRRPEWLPEPAKAPGAVFCRSTAIRDTGLQGACAIPVQAGSQVVAVLVFYTGDSSAEDSLRTQALTAAVAPLAAFLKRIVAEDALRDADTRLNLALDAAAVGTWDWDFDSGALIWDAHMLPLYGVTRDTAPADIDAFNLMVHPDDRDGLAREIQATVDEHRDFEAGFRIVRRDDGRVRVIFARGRVFRDGSQRPVRMIGVNWDVTAEREAQAEIQELARFYLENPRPVLRIAADGRVLLSNPASELLLDGSGAAPRAPRQVLDLLPQVIGSGAVLASDLEVGERVVRLSLVPVADQGYVNAYGEDVTEERKTAERMRQAQKMEAVGQLTGGIAHDFNNRLTVISGNLELVEMKLADDADTVKLIGHARRAADGAAKLTRQLLIFARRQVEEPESVDVNDRIRGLREMIGRSLGEAVELNLNLCASAWPVFTDSGQLEDALLNLCVNARDAMPGGGRLSIESENVRLDAQDMEDRPYMQPGEYVMIAVTDTGCGIPREILDRVFEPYFTTKEVGKGTGLGLSMVYGFAKQSGGYLHVYSEVDHGTCFKIYLPRQERREEAREDNVGAGLVAGSGRILMVEDDDGVRQVASRMLRSLGYTVMIAENGPAALAVLEDNADFDLLFTDVIMPGGMTGFELAQRVQERWPLIRLLFTSGYTDRGPFKDAKEQLQVNWVLKPYTQARLASRVHEVLSATEGGAIPPTVARGRNTGARRDWRMT